MTKPKTPQISIRGETYKKLREEAQKQGTTITNLVERMISNQLDSFSSPLTSPLADLHASPKQVYR